MLISVTTKNMKQCIAVYFTVLTPRSQETLHGRDRLEAKCKLYGINNNKKGLLVLAAMGQCIVCCGRCWGSASVPGPDGPAASMDEGGGCWVGSCRDGGPQQG